MGGEGEDGGVGREEAKNRLLWWVGCGRGQSPPFFPFFNNDDKKPCYSTTPFLGREKSGKVAFLCFVATWPFWESDVDLHPIFCTTSST